jgi:Transglycosylase SLT domain
MTAKIGITALGAIIVIPVLIAALTQGVFSLLVGSGTSQPSMAALTDIPADYLTLYHNAATVCPGLDWSVLAGIGKMETNHGRLNAPGVHSGENQARAGGPMQFLQSTFDSVTSRHTIPPGGANPPSRYDPHDAIYAAAYYLCDNGARDQHNLHQAIFTYNHADWYVHKVLNQATLYANAPPATAPPSRPPTPRHGPPSTTPAGNAAYPTSGAATAPPTADSTAAD